MIVVSMSGGLANQMFQYAFYLHLKDKGLNVMLDQSNFTPRESMTCETTRVQDVFNNTKFELMPAGMFPLTYWKRRWRFLRSLAWIWGDKYIPEPTFAYHPEIFKKASKNCIFYGSWQCEKYFKNIESEVRKQFTFRPFEDERNKELALKMSKENSIALHIRKGKDYTTEFLLQNTCPLEYYLNAIEYIKKHVDKPIFYIFTDNPTWVSEHLKNINYTLIDWNPIKGLNNYLDMQLMSCAKHNIISNSTYSWWGAWLNKNVEKIVVAPKFWFNPKMKLRMYSGNEIVCEDWIKL